MMVHEHFIERERKSQNSGSFFIGALISKESKTKETERTATQTR
jgi:hypothetical protein